MDRARSRRLKRGQQALSGNRHARPEPRIGLGDLDPNGAAADADHGLRKTIVLENLAVGEKRHLTKARQGRFARLGPRRDEDAFRPDTPLADRQRVPIDETCRAKDEVDADRFDSISSHHLNVSLAFDGYVLDLAVPTRCSSVVASFCGSFCDVPKGPAVNSRPFSRRGPHEKCKLHARAFVRATDGRL